MLQMTHFSTGLELQSLLVTYKLHKPSLHVNITPVHACAHKVLYGCVCISDACICVQLLICRKPTRKLLVYCSNEVNSIC